MATILDKIIEQKKIEVQALQAAPVADERSFPIYSFKEQLKKDKMNIIAEIKRASPSKGTINADVDPVAQAKQYEALGASAISVLTDQKFFNGSMDDLRAVAKAVNLPVLCKDFMVDKIQIDTAKAAGASIILLIAAALPQAKLKELYAYAKAEGLEVLVEVHNEAEMEQALALGADVIGINNRDLKTFDVDLNTTGRLANMVQNRDTILVSESGIRTQGDAERVGSLGASVILVGETLMRSEDLAKTFDRLSVPLPDTKDAPACS